MFPESFFCITYKSNYRKINLILKSFWDCSFFVYFVGMQYLQTQERKYEKYSHDNKRKQKQENTAKRKEEENHELQRILHKAIKD